MKFYVLSKAEKSFCPECHASVDMLAARNMTGVKFWICWACKKVWEIGIGEAKRQD